MKRQTLQKTIILDALMRLGNHPTPAMVYDEIHKDYPTISKATVFRVLAGECEEGNAQRIYAGGSARYECGTKKHWHISCRLCGKVADVELPFEDDLLHSVKNNDGFTAERYFIEFIGLCPECKSSETSADENK